MSTDQITILTNPPQHYFEEIVKEAVLKHGWINSIHDYEAYRNSFPENDFKLLVAVDSKTKEFIGNICVATYTKPQPLSAIGMFLVKEEWQGKGVGIRLFDEAIKVCAPRRFLYGVEKMMPKYRDRYGFNKQPDWNLLAFKTEVQNLKPLQLNYDPILQFKLPQEVGWDAIGKYYQKILPQLDGSSLIKGTLEEEGSHNGVVTKEGKIVGLVRIRETYNNELCIGPLYADNEIAACTVLRHVLCRFDTLKNFKSIWIQFPSTNKEALDLLTQLTNGNFKMMDHLTYPQWTDEVFELPTHQIYAVSQNHIAIV